MCVLRCFVDVVRVLCGFVGLECFVDLLDYTVLSISWVKMFCRFVWLECFVDFLG
jgi:hypothetical protein